MKKTSTDQAIRTATGGVVLAVGGFAGAVSYSHIYDLARQHGQNITDARLLPLSVDGLIVAASFLILHEARACRDVPKLAGWMLAVGVITTVLANIAYGVKGGAYDAIVSAWPAVSFLGCAEMLTYLLRVSRTRRAPAARSAPVLTSVPDRVPPAVPAGPGPSAPGRTLEDEFAAEIAAGRIPGVKQIQRRMGGGQDTAYKHQERLRALAVPVPA
jgi:hypothetical protein